MLRSIKDRRFYALLASDNMRGMFNKTNRMSRLSIADRKEKDAISMLEAKKREMKTI